MAVSPPNTVLLLLLLFVPSSSAIPSFSLSHYRTILSLAHSLTTRVSLLRASRGDLAGSARAKALARNIESLQGLGLWKLSWSLGWDYVRNYAWRDFSSPSFSLSDLSELINTLSELSRVGSDSERLAWAARNYSRVLAVARSLFERLLRVYRQPGPVREFVETVQREVVDGGLLRDCLELGAKDVKGLVQILKDIALQYAASSSRTQEL